MRLIWGTIGVEPRPLGLPLIPPFGLGDGGGGEVSPVPSQTFAAFNNSHPASGDIPARLGELSA
ncbi:hypothetical protein [Pseudonocardia sp. ICBG601]|uniref:hypothetical protein n=1 Tax=Pseudonocardia sp. ICBG601 TaxID=2846759 RepID=UPI001CF66CE2|nr:hypothetical protein [Pseudonocardia sp. ICBG601]